MLHGTLNLGILAHVDAGKTTLTERLLYDGGVIAAPGSVDRGTTQTDTLALERERGITIKAAVASFAVGDVGVNLVDTPGHPDFIAEVERSLGVLDAAILVVSAVEGVQAQTLVLWRALERLRLPTIVFVNKLDRRGADPERVLEELWTRLSLDIEPVYGSALTGAGLDELRAAIVGLPRRPGDPGAPLAAQVFKIDRSARGEKIAYLRVFDGAVHVRDRIGDEKVTALEVPGRGHAEDAVAGDIAKVWGLRSVRIGDRLGSAGPVPPSQFAPPTLQAVVEPLDPRESQKLRVALMELAEQDPLIGVRQDGDVLSITIYGEVQKEVLEATLQRDFGIAVAFSETTPIHVERPLGTGEGSELLNAPTNPFHAQLGLRVEPGDGVEVRVTVADHTRIPLYVYKRREEFDAAMEAYVRESLRTGLHGWEVIDCAVTVFDSWYSLADGPPSRRGPLPTAHDFRGLTPIVLRQALAQAGTVVCEPFAHVRLEVPADALGATLAAAARLGASVEATEQGVVEGELPAVRVSALQRQLPALTRGEGVLESSFAGYRPAVSAVPG
ncbi:MAG TPA: translation factor GTPase family protein [Gaiellaceae bacterium]